MFILLFFLVITSVESWRKYEESLQVAEPSQVANSLNFFIQLSLQNGLYEFTFVLEDVLSMSTEYEYASLSIHDYLPESVGALS